MNGVAKQFWSEVLDLHSPVGDDRGGRKSTRRSRKTTRKALSSQPRRRARPAA